MSAEDLCHRYLAALEAGDLDAVLALFAPGATVLSPLYGTRTARDFYSDLFADTARSETELLNIFPVASSGRAAALHFRYRWTLANGEKVGFEVADVFEIAADGMRFESLTILYDTAPLRDRFDAARTSN